MRTKPIRGRLANKLHPLTPTAAWIMNEGSGNKIYDIIGNNHGTFGAGAAAPSWVPEGLYFDGDDYIDCGTLTGVNGSIGTIGIWINMDNWSSTNNEYFFDLYANINNFARIYHQTTPYLYFQYRSGGTIKQIFNSNPGAYSGWHYFMITWDENADEFKAYIDGAQYGSTQTGLGTWSGSPSFKIGSENTGSKNLNGFSDVVTVYDWVLNAKENWRVYVDPYCWLAQPEDLASLYVSIGQEYTESIIIELQSKYNQLSIEEYQLLKILQTLDKKEI